MPMWWPASHDLPTAIITNTSVGRERALGRGLMTNWKGVTEGFFDISNMISKGLYRPGHCTSR